MKVLIALFALVLTVSGLTDEEQWISFKTQHGKAYRSLREEQLRFQIFSGNLRKIEVHNSRYEAGLETYEMGVNQFTDLTEVEFVNTLNSVKPDVPILKKFVRNPNYKLASTNFDWRTKGAVLPVRNQDGCGSCWAFASTGTLEAHNFLKNNQSIVLSPQELVDCAKSYNTNGCRGGDPVPAFWYVKDHGIAADKDYTYVNADGTCQNGSYPRVKLNVTGWTIIEQDEDKILEALETVGPLAINVNANLFLSYKKGIFNSDNCPTQTNHCVVMVGHGTENGLRYWIIKNSWGTKFGEDGYIRMARTGKSLCGMYSQVVYPNIQPNA